MIKWGRLLAVVVFGTAVLGPAVSPAPAPASVICSESPRCEKLGELEQAKERFLEAKEAAKARFRAVVEQVREEEHPECVAELLKCPKGIPRSLGEAKIAKAKAARASALTKAKERYERRVTRIREKARNRGSEKTREQEEAHDLKEEQEEREAAPARLRRVNLVPAAHDPPPTTTTKPLPSPRP